MWRRIILKSVPFFHFELHLLQQFLLTKQKKYLQALDSFFSFKRYCSCSKAGWTIQLRIQNQVHFRTFAQPFIRKGLEGPRSGWAKLNYSDDNKYSGFLDRPQFKQMSCSYLRRFKTQPGLSVLETFWRGSIPLLMFAAVAAGHPDALLTFPARLEKRQML